jgi:hypothetical protein
MNEPEFFSATLRCDGCKRLLEVPLDGVQAERYVAFIEQRDFDAAMGVVRAADAYPRDWVQRPEIVVRDTLRLDRHTGVLQGSSRRVKSFLDFCPACQRVSD